MITVQYMVRPGCRVQGTLNPLFILLVAIAMMVSSLVLVGEEGWAEIILDGSLGQQGEIAGPNYSISDDLGKIEGTNLFHSFQTFNLNTGESATFTGPSTVENIISRVTGGEPSLIDGTLRSISSSTSGTGSGGNIDILADESILISGQSQKDDKYFSGIYCKSEGGGGQAGSLTIKTTCLTATFGGGIDTSASGDGYGGDISIEVKDLTLTEGGSISSILFGNGEAGHIDIVAEDSIFISGFYNEFSSGIFSNPQEGSVGQAGLITIETSNLTLQDKGVIRGSTSGQSSGADICIKAENIEIRDGGEISSNTLSSESGGSITIFAKENIFISQQATKGALRTGVFSQSTSQGEAGHIFIEASNSLFCNNSSITTETNQADGGNIQLAVGHMLKLTDSQITATVKGGQGNGGNIAIDPDFVILDQSRIVAQAVGGTGGNISIVADLFLASSDSLVSASSQLGLDGKVEISSPLGNHSWSLIPLPDSFLKADALLPKRCADRGEEELSSFLLISRKGYPPQPTSLLSSP